MEDHFAPNTRMVGVSKSLKRDGAMKKNECQRGSCFVGESAPEKFPDFQRNSYSFRTSEEHNKTNNKVASTLVSINFQSQQQQCQPAHNSSQFRQHASHEQDAQKTLSITHANDDRAEAIVESSKHTHHANLVQGIPGGFSHCVTPVTSL